MFYKEITNKEPKQTAYIKEEDQEQAKSFLNRKKSTQRNEVPRKKLTTKMITTI